MANGELRFYHERHLTEEGERSISLEELLMAPVLYVVMNFQLLMIIFIYWKRAEIDFTQRAPHGSCLICHNEFSALVNNFYILFNSRAVLIVFVLMALYFTFYNLFVVMRSLLSQNEFLHSTLGILRWLFLFTLFSFSSHHNLFPDR